MSSIVAEPVEFAERGDRVRMWRLEKLLEAGYPYLVADVLAGRPWHEVDLHLAVELITVRGCSVDVAKEILL